MVVCDLDEIEISDKLKREICIVQRTLYLYIMPIVLVLGTCSNGFVLYVFRRARYKNLSVGVYMRTYCIMNILCLYFAYGLDWFTQISHLKNLEDLSDITCRFVTFISTDIVFITPWLVVAMVIDRYIAFQHPISASSLTTSFMAKVTTAIIFVGVSVVCVHALWVYEVHPEVGYCRAQIEKSGQITLHVKIFSWLSATCNQYLPMLLMFIFCILLLTSTCMKTKESRFRTSGNQQTELTATVLALSIMCLIITLPTLSMHIVTMSMNHVEDQERSHRIQYVTQILDILAYSNQVTVLFVCIIFSATFRTEAKASLMKFKKTISSRRSDTSEMKVVSRSNSIQFQNDEESANTLL